MIYLFCKAGILFACLPIINAVPAKPQIGEITQRADLNPTVRSWEDQVAAAYDFVCSKTSFSSQNCTWLLGSATSNFYRFNFTGFPPPAAATDALYTIWISKDNSEYTVVYPRLSGGSDGNFEFGGVRNLTLQREEDIRRYGKLSEPSGGMKIGSQRTKFSEVLLEGQKAGINFTLGSVALLSPDAPSVNSTARPTLKEASWKFVEKPEPPWASKLLPASVTIGDVSKKISREPRRVPSYDEQLGGRLKSTTHAIGISDAGVVHASTSNTTLITWDDTVRQAMNLITTKIRPGNLTWDVNSAISYQPLNQADPAPWRTADKEFLVSFVSSNKMEGIIMRSLKPRGGDWYHYTRFNLTETRERAPAHHPPVYKISSETTKYEDIITVAKNAGLNFSVQSVFLNKPDPEDRRYYPDGQEQELFWNLIERANKDWSLEWGAAGFLIGDRSRRVVRVPRRPTGSVPLTDAQSGDSRPIPPSGSSAYNPNVPSSPWDIPGDPWDEQHGGGSAYNPNVPGDPWDIPGDPWDEQSGGSASNPDVPSDPFDVPSDPWDRGYGASQGPNSNGTNAATNNLGALGTPYQAAVQGSTSVS